MYKTFFSWLFNNDVKSPIPRGENIPDILKYNSPITSTYIISLFLNNGPLNYYLDSYFNNMDLRYIDKEELFYFIKKCVIDFRISRRSLVWVKYNNKTNLFNMLRKKIPILKNEEIDMLCKIIETSSDKDQIYVSLGLDKPVKKKLKTKKKITKGKISLQNFLYENFSIMDKSQ